MSRVSGERLSEIEVYQNKLLGEIASRVVDEFLEILEPWFQPDHNGLLQRKADEFLFEGVLRELEYYHSKMTEEMFRQQNTKNEGTDPQMFVCKTCGGQKTRVRGEGAGMRCFNCKE